MLFRLTVLLCLLLQATQVNAFAKKGKLLFDELMIESAVTLTHPVLVVDMFGDTAKEIVTLGVDGNGERWLHVYKYLADKSNYQLDSTLQLPRNISRFDVSRFSQGNFQSLYFLSASTIYRYQPVKKSLMPLTEVNSIFLDKTPQFISRGRFVVDINDDGIDELLVSDFTALNLLHKDKTGKYASMLLGDQPNMVLDHNGMRFLPKKYYIFDIDNDGLKDLVIGGEGMLRSFNQQADGSVSAIAREYPLNNKISAVDWWMKRDETGDSLDQANLTYRTLVDLQDINYDGITDMVVKATESSGVLDRVNDYEVYLGQWRKGSVAYSQQPSSVISAEGTLSGFELVDINNDHKLEAILAGFDIGLSQVIGALLSGGIDQDVYLFDMDNEDNFKEEASVEKEVELSFSLTSGQTGSPVVKLADINGDKLKDLVLSYGEKRLKVYFATTNARMFEKRGVKYKTTLPQDGDAIVVSDLNNDGKDDLVFKYGPLDDKALVKTIRLLIAK